MASFSSLADAIKALSNNKDSTCCNLTGVPVRDSGVSDLLFCVRKTKVSELILANCNLGVQAAIHLAAFLKYNKTVTRLYLQHNPDIGDEGLEALAKVFSTNEKIQILNVAGCAVGNIGICHLCEELQSVDASRCSLRKLFLYNNMIGDLGASAIAEFIIHTSQTNTTGNFALEEVFLWDNKLTDTGVDELKNAYNATAKDDGNPYIRRLQIVTGLKNESVAKKSAPAAKRNFKLPSDKKNEPLVDTTKTTFSQLQARAQELEQAPSTPALLESPRRKKNVSSVFAEVLKRTNSAGNAPDSSKEFRTTNTRVNVGGPSTKNLQWENKAITHHDDGKTYGICMSKQPVPVSASKSDTHSGIDLSESDCESDSSSDEDSVGAADDGRISETALLQAKIDALKLQIADVG